MQYPAFPVLELVEPVRAHRGEVEGHDVGLVAIQASGALEHWEHVWVGLERQYDSGRSDRQGDGDRRVACVRADVDRDVTGTQEPTQLIDGRLHLGGSDTVGAGVQPARDLHPTLSGEVVRLDHESERLRLRFEAERVDELLDFQLACPRPGRTQ